MLKHLFNFLIFPGFLFTAVIGLAASWIDRKVSARVQWRVGPPWYQPFIDLVKLSLKEVIVPRDASLTLFFIAPFLGLSSVILVSTMLWNANINPFQGFIGDIIVILYLLTIPAISTILGASASRNPLASVGASREIKLVLAYELPLILSIFIPILKSGGLLRLGELILYQENYNVFLKSPSGIIAAFVALLCIQAKLGLIPFDISEAETEIMAGSIIEYSGMLLAIQRLTKIMLMVAAPIFLISIFWGGIGSDFSGIWKYIVVLVLIILIRNTNPRLRIDQIMRFFWGRMSPLAIIGIILALLGI